MLSYTSPFVICSHLSLSPQEMRDAFLEFDTAKEGHISLDELQAVLSRYNMLPAEVAEIFQGIDVAGSGRIE